jgi:hypothetical protein
MNANNFIIIFFGSVAINAFALILLLRRKARGMGVSFVGLYKMYAGMYDKSDRQDALKRLNEDTSYKNDIKIFRYLFMLSAMSSVVSIIGVLVSA